MVVPKVTHQVWFQGWDKLPEKYREDAEKLSDFNQNWEHKKWDEHSLRAECEKFSPEALLKFEEFTNMIHKVDFGRYIVLYNHGGVSVDCDSECLRPLEKVPGIDRYDLILGKNSLTKLENKVASYGLSRDLVIVNNASLCCSKENPLMKQFIEFLIKNESWNEDLLLDTQLKTGPLALSVFFNRHIDDVLILDSDVFEPFGNVTKRTVLNHKYDQSWTGYGTLPITMYKFIKNNLVWILLIVIILIKFLFFRRVLEKSLG
jgi:mannosyltransferase OCH1-like enzyme